MRLKGDFRENVSKSSYFDMRCSLYVASITTGGGN